MIVREVSQPRFPSPPLPQPLAPFPGPEGTPLARGTGDEATGFVSLVGAGPGDPELLTLKALRRLRLADAVVYDRLVSAEILDLARPDAVLFDVGKAPGRHACRQEGINELLVRLGRAGLRVARLKGGDPFVFGRGGEEALALQEAEVPFEVVPGVSSALAAPAAAGIPVTHRGLATSVTIATGHARAEASDLDHDWEALARQRGTLVFLMAVENLETIVERLLAHGRDPDEPAAIVQNATTPDQRVICAPLQTIVREARLAALAPPAVLVVGPTARLARSIRQASQQIAPAGESFVADTDPIYSLDRAPQEQETPSYAARTGMSQLTASRRGMTWGS